MLAYVFWHWPAAGVDRADYEATLARFHGGLAGASPDGFRASVAFRLDAPPWTRPDGAVYEDWYLVDGSAALDPLNDGAVSGACAEPHARVASLAAGGAGGLYRLRRGDARAAGEVGFALWFSKPDRMRYDDLDEALAGVAGAGAAVWGRQMVLGPAPEFCLHAPGAVELPRGLDALERRLEAVWP